jgi:hypothetical protein
MYTEIDYLDQSDIMIKDLPGSAVVEVLTLVIHLLQYYIFQNNYLFKASFN